MIILSLKDKKTYEKHDFTFSCSEVYISPTGLWAEDSNADSPFIDILKVTNVRRKVDDKWKDYFIDTFSDGSIVYRYQRNRNIYNRHDIPTVVIVGEN